MEKTPLAPVLEALLFVADEPLTVGQLARLAETKQAEVEEALITLSRDCQERGIRLQRHLDAVQLVSAPEMALYIERLLGAGVERRLSGAALEVLAIVAYRQPITRAAIEAIRGVNSDRALRTLQTLGMIAETGRLETVGRPLLFGTTFEFLQHFGLGSLDDLPPVEEMIHASGATLAQQLPLPGEPGGRPATHGQPARRRTMADQGQTGETTQE